MGAPDMTGRRSFDVFAIGGAVNAFGVVV